MERGEPVPPGAMVEVERACAHLADPRPAAIAGVATLAAGLIGLGLGLWSSVGAPGRRAGRAVGPAGAA